MNVEGQYNPKDVECIPVENLEVLPSGADWQSRHLESERRKAEIRDRIHKQTEQGAENGKRLLSSGETDTVDLRQRPEACGGLCPCQHFQRRTDFFH